MPNPYSADLYASPEIFRGYGDPVTPRAPGGWTLQEIAGSWLQLHGPAPSFWVVGHRKLGKTSLLLRLAYLLRLEGQGPENPRIVVPLYLSCKGVATLAAFYSKLLARAGEILAAGAGQAPSPWNLDVGKFALLRTDPQRTDLELLDLAIDDLDRLAEQVSLGSRQEARIVLLLDDVGAAVDAGWAGSLFEHLRTLLNGWPFLFRGNGSRRKAFVVALASDWSLEKKREARGLLELLEELPVRSLGVAEVTALITVSGPVELDPRWRFRIYKATAGHPWLVQFVMKHVVDSFGPDVQRHDQLFEAIITERFQESSEGAEILGHYLKHFHDNVRILAELAVDRQGISLPALAAKTGLSAAALGERLEAMVRCGVLYQPPGDAPEAEGRYALGDIFRHWFLAHTGFASFVDEIERRREAGTREREDLRVSNAPFMVTMGLSPDFLLADGLYTRLLGLNGELIQESFALIDLLVQSEGQKKNLDVVAQNLRKMLRQSEWEPVWSNYCQKAAAEGRQPRFVLRVSDKSLYAFPIEVLKFDDRPLGLSAPVYKELMADQRETAYRLCRNSLPLDPSLNVLLVGSGRRGTFRNREYPGLGYVAEEVREIVRLLLEEGSDHGVEIGKIAALVDAAVELPEAVQRLAPSAANLKRALRGGLGLNFHLFHYCGHYIPNDGDEEGGFLLRDGDRLELFNLASWRNALAQQKTLKLVCLSACGSAGHVPEPNLYHLGAAHTALTSGVPAVIGMRWSIKDSQGYSFSSVFYPQLLQSGVPELALFEARAKLLEMESASTLWAAPVMLTR
jgi:CHAT domain